MSMGGLMAFQVALKRPTLINGCILLNPAFRDNPIDSGLLKKLVMLGGLILPKFKVTKSVKNNSSSYSLRKYRENDKLIYSGRIWASTIWNLLSYMRKVAK
jgi:alpha-beta hydrolase superfamily lysophospholipase